MVKCTILWGESILTRVASGKAGFLARTSIEAQIVPDLAQLLDVAVLVRPDLVALDGASTALPALPACRRLQDDERTRSIPLLAVAIDDPQAEMLRRAGCFDVLPGDAAPAELQRRIAGILGMRLRRHRRYGVVLPVARGRIFHEFLGYSSSLSEGGMGFETSALLRGGDHLLLRLYRNTEEEPISVLGRVCSVRQNIDTGSGYAIGIEFFRLETTDRRRLLELFPAETVFLQGDPANSGEPLPGVSR